MGWLVLVAIQMLVAGCLGDQTKSLEVTATAFNAVSSQTTKDHAAITAWGDELKPGMKCIAVSRDLIQMGLTHNTEVKIDGLPGTYKVLDKMNKRWTKKIDIYMGDDIEAAREWGVRTVVISWKASTGQGEHK